MNRSSLWKLAGLAAVLAAITWFAAGRLLPVRLPDDFPVKPDLSKAPKALVSAIETADANARSKPASAELTGKLAMTYHANQFFDQAAAGYRIAVRNAPGTYRWAYAQAVLAEESGNAAAEVQAVREALRAKPDDVPALMKLADWAFKSGQLDDAEQAYQKALAGAVLQATLGLGRVAGRRSDWKRVVDLVSPLAQSYSYVLQPHELLLEAYTALGILDKAAQAKESMALAKWRVVPPVEDPLNDELAAVSYSSTRLLKQAGVYSRVGQPDRGIELARRAAQVDPTDPEVHNFLARALLTFHADQPAAVDEALSALAECLRLRPADLLPLWGFADDFFKSPKQPAAVERLAALLTPHAVSPDAHYSLGLLADARGDAQQAIAHYQAALKVRPDDSAVFNKLGQIALRAGNAGQAIASFEKAVALNPMNTGARLNLGVALLDSHRYTDAIAALAELVRRSPQDAPAQFCMGFACLYAKRADEAIARFREGLRYQPGDAEAHFGLAQALYAKRDREGAVTEAREALRLRPDFAPAQEMLRELGR